MNRFSPLVVPVSIDEGFLDLSAEADGAARWRELSATVLREVGLNLSGRAGKFALAWRSWRRTPRSRAFWKLSAGREKEFLAARNLRELSGIGESTRERIGCFGRADVRRRGRAALDAAAAAVWHLGTKIVFVRQRRMARKSWWPRRGRGR